MKFEDRYAPDWQWKTDEQPSFYARKRGNHIVVKGTHDCFLSTGNNANHQWHGPFVQWTWDGSCLRAWNDWSGFFPLYFWTSHDEIGLSPSIPALLIEGAPTELNEAALAVFLRVGFFIGDQTSFAKITALPPGSMLEWRDGKTTLTSSWKLASPQRFGQQEAKERYAALFKAAIQRRLTDGSFALPLSGGRDSRHILLELCESGCRPTACLTYRHLPPRGNQDAIVASKLSASMRVNHILVDQPDSRLDAERRKNVLASFCADELAEYIAMADYVRGKYNWLYDGIGGDVLSNGLFLDEERHALYGDGKFEELAQNIISNFQFCFRSEQESALQKLLHREQYRRFGRDLAIHTLSVELKKYADAPNPVASFFFWNRTRREITLAPHAILASVAQVHCPYLDQDLYEFLASQPAYMFMKHDFHDETIAMAYPSMAKIPYDKEVDPGTKHISHHSRVFAQELMSYALRKRSSQFISFAYLLPRLARGAFARYYGETLFSGRCLGPYLVYLLQLERAIAEPSRAM